jgi:hypothetical protein
VMCVAELGLRIEELRWCGGGLRHRGRVRHLGDRREREAWKLSLGQSERIGEARGRWWPVRRVKRVELERVRAREGDAVGGAHRRVDGRDLFGRRLLLRRTGHRRNRALEDGRRLTDLAPRPTAHRARDPRRLRVDGYTCSLRTVSARRLLREDPCDVRHVELAGEGARGRRRTAAGERRVTPR